MKYIKKRLTVLLAVIMLVNTMPLPAYAEESTPEQMAEGSTDTERNTAGIAFANSFRQILIDAGYAETNIDNIVQVDVDTNAVTLGIATGEDIRILALLSQQSQTAEENYQNWNIKFTVTGDLILSDDFRGLGDEGFPFQGRFTDQAITITTAQTLFKALSSNADLNGVQLSWKGEADSPILTRILEADGAGGTINMPLSGAACLSPYIGEVKLTPGAGTSGVVVLPALNYSAAQESQKKYADDLGLICGRMGAGTRLQMGILQLPEGENYCESTENVGTLVGRMEEGAQLIVTENLTLTTRLVGANVGGLVGSMDKATVFVSEGKSIALSTTLLASENAGGVAGCRTVSENDQTTASGTITLNAVDAKGTKNAGILYGTCTVGNAGNSGDTMWFDPFKGISYGENAVCKVSGETYCGGVFGTLSLVGNGSCSIAGAENNVKAWSTSLSDARNTTAYGGVAGCLTGVGSSNALRVQWCSAVSSVDVGADITNYPKYMGGLAAKQEGATLDAGNVTADIRNPKTKKDTDYGFGGMTAYLGDGALLIADTVKVITDSYLTNPGGGGIVGSAHKGSIVWLRNRIDLSQCQLSTNATTGQIVGSQDCSFIYAPEATISRLETDSYNGMELDDIGNYGELYRISDFLYVGEDYASSFSNQLTMTDNVCVLNNATDYACLALAWQARGYFPTVRGITKDNWSTIKTSTIRLGADINLTGCGIGGLTRDVKSSEDTFTGTFDGAGKKITLDIGAENQDSGKKVPKGDGRIYRHNATGLFAVLSNSAQVQNLTLAGSIRIQNSLTGMCSGGLAAILSCDSEQSQDAELLDGVSTEVTFDMTVNGGSELYAGGLFGLVSEKGEARILLEAGSRLAAQMEIAASGNGQYNHFGGFIGAVQKDTDLDLVCSGAVLSGSIEETGSVNHCYAGGLIGTMLPGGSGKRKITLSGLVVDQFSLSSGADTRMGGILGGIWSNTDVEVTGLTVTNTTLTAERKTALGGLLYRGSGKWTISSVDLDGLTISAENAGALGLLVCHGEPNQEPINTSAQNIGGLYLEMTEHWDWNDTDKKGYRVPESISYSGGVFDEFVAYTAYADGGSYDITRNGSGIISLKTDNGTVNMTKGEQRNTYVNRSAVGQSSQTNLYSRYYYDLSDALPFCNGGEIDTARELLLWSVYRYAASNLKSYFQIDNVTSNVIGGTSEAARASFDMKGLSYYPISVNNSALTLQNADVTFYNQEIEAKEVDNKQTRGTAAAHSQHYMMHCGLFLDYTADTSAQADCTMTVNGVSFAGTVGVVNGGSGALLCGSVQGDSKSGLSSTCKVILANGDEASKAITLKGLAVELAGDYTPVLINHIGSYAGLKANYVTTSDEQKFTAGSSLIGDVGGQGAVGVSVEFAGTIKLPEQGVFTKALLLNSLRYDTGSATYRFTKSKDYDGDKYLHNATHGRELSTSVEYVGKQGCYYDGYGEGYYVSANSSFDSQNDFNAYLPYVALSPAVGDADHTLANNWHELAVNVLSTDLTDGCGTYGHPYQVDANLLKEVVNYINTGAASVGWQVRVPKDQTYHSTDSEHDVLLTYTQNGWKDEENKDYAKSVRQYLADAYFVIKEDIELTDFAGIGTDGSGGGLPFTGVIVGRKSDGSIPTVTLSGGTAAFIKYSYGCVIRDLKIVLNQTPTLTRPTWTRGTAEQAPKTFFGGVIGCVLGGDSIIENVTVNKGEDFSVSVTGTGIHLVPVGGYVGVIAGGGVIFRGICSDNTGISGTNEQLYRNPIIGRVLGGFAFYEGDGSAPDNSDKNYKINQLTLPKDPNQKDLDWDEKTLTVNTAQGLFVLSAIISSGAGSNSSNAYVKGRARNALYDRIGEAAEPEDYALALQDAGTVWADGNTPYLLKKYAGYTGGKPLCNSVTNGIAIVFAKNASFDMSGFDNGYRGLSARYVSNAAFSGSTVDASLVVLRVSSFDGQNATVQNINMNVNEYADDDFHAASLGGIFNIVWTNEQSGGKADSYFARDLTLTNCNVSLKYVNVGGEEQAQADDKTFSDGDGRRAVSVGGFIGMANDIDASTTSQKTLTHNYLFSNIHITADSNNDKRSTIYGPNAAGGLIGTTAMASTAVTGYPGILLANGKWALFGPSFLNCSYRMINISGGLAAGGLVGDVYANSSGTVPGFSGLGIAYSNGGFKPYTSCTVTEEELIVGEEATITARAKASIAGGLFGGAGMRVGVNDPEVNTKSGLTVLGEDPQIKPLQLSSVHISVSVTDFVSGSNPDNGANNAYAAGIIGRIGNVNPSSFFDISIRGGSVTSTNATSSYVGGIQGSGYTNSTITIQRCQITDFAVSGANAGGFLGSGKTASSFTLLLSDSKIENSSVSGTGYAGGLVGEAASNYYLYNLLIKNTSITANNAANAGRLFGRMNINAAGNDFKVYAAGISVYADSSAAVTIPEKVGNDGGKSYIGYIAYADYAGTDSDAASGQYPYVTANPSYSLTEDHLLTGDAVGKIADDTYNSVAARIWADQKTGAADRKNLVSYPKAASIVNTVGKAAPVVSTFHAEQECGPADLPVLVISGSDASIIEDYLNVITNGGYSEAKVTPEVTYYEYSGDKFSLITQEQMEAKKEPAAVYRRGDGTLRINSNSYDNGRKRFSLVEASFTVEINKEKRTYTVSVPVIVKRELQYNSITTLTYGAEYDRTVFSDLKTHVLESAGNPITAYLTIQYNRNRGDYVDYDWQGYLNDGGNMLAVDKQIAFSSGLPKETQLLLVDCQDGNRAYSYETDGSSKILLSSFASVDGSNELFRSSMADILGVTVTENAKGSFVETGASDATLRRNGKYYRPVKDGDAEGTKRYDMTVPNLSKLENLPEENYFLVITVPEQQHDDFYLNGTLSIELVWSMPNRGTRVHRYNGLPENVGNNDESTYQISEGYSQDLTVLTEPGTVDLADSHNKMQVKVKDEITFSNGQAYGDNDHLYFVLTADLQEHVTEENGAEIVRRLAFPSGTSGQATFYIQDMDGNYYVKTDNGWSKMTEESAVSSYLWNAQGNDMKLLLSEDGVQALDLSGVRKLIKGSQTKGNSKIIITAVMSEIVFTGQNAIQDTIPASDSAGTDKWAQMNYTARISVLESTLNYSSASAAGPDTVKYYRGVQNSAELSLYARNIGQLGINPLELVPEYLSEDQSASRIDLVATLDLVKLASKDRIKELLKNTEEITFTLSLKQGGRAEYGEELPNMEDYISFDTGTAWTIARSEYYDEATDSLILGETFDGTRFLIPVTAYVNVKKEEFANYRIDLKVKFTDTDAESDIAITDTDAYIIYTYACIRPDFFEKK